MNITREMAQYLDTAGFGTLGTDIFAGQIPDSQNGVYVVQGGGSPHLYTPIEEAVLDIYVKNTKAATGIELIQDIKRFIHRMHTTTVNDAFIYTMIVIGDVEEVVRDLEYAKIYKITVLVTHRDTDLIS